MGDDIVYGGLGDDSINNDFGAATVFVYNLGDGNDTISTYASGSDDVLELGEGILADDLIVTGQDDDLIIKFKDSEGSIRLTRGFDVIKRIENFKFSDGTVLSHSQVKDIISQQKNASQNIQTTLLSGNTDDSLYLPEINSYDVNVIIQDMSGYAPENGIVLNAFEENRNNADLMTLVNA